MKSEITKLPPPPPAFVPFVLTIKVETIEEARALRLVRGNIGTVSNSLFVPGSYGAAAAAANGVTDTFLYDTLHGALCPISDINIGYRI